MSSVFWILAVFSEFWFVLEAALISVSCASFSTLKILYNERKEKRGEREREERERRERESERTGERRVERR
jgi:hypothetical protein